MVKIIHLYTIIINSNSKSAIKTVENTKRNICTEYSFYCVVCSILATAAA